MVLFKESTIVSLALSFAAVSAGCNPFWSSSIDNNYQAFEAAGGGTVSAGGSCTAGTATANDALAGVTFPDGAGGMTTGTMANRGNWSLSDASAIAAPTFPGAGYYSGISNAPATSSYCAGTYINGSNGTAVCASGATTGTTITAAEVCSSYSGYNLSGSAINGTKNCPEVGTPANISGLVFWMKADAITGSSDGNSLGVWRDSTANSLDGYAATSLPLYKTAIVNGKPVVRTSGTTNRFIIPPRSAIEITGDITLVVAAYPTQNGDDGNYHHLIAKRDFASDSQYNIFLQSSGGTGSANGTNPGLGGSLGIYTYKSGASYSLLNSTGVVSKNTWHILIVTISGNTVSFFDNGTAKGTDTILANTRPTTSTVDNLVLFQAGTTDSSGPFQGDMAEILIYNNALSNANRQTVECYLSNKYGLALTGC